MQKGDSWASKFAIRLQKTVSCKKEVLIVVTAFKRHCLPIPTILISESTNFVLHTDQN